LCHLSSHCLSNTGSFVVPILILKIIIWICIRQVPVPLPVRVCSYRLPVYVPFTIIWFFCTKLLLLYKAVPVIVWKTSS
jgi:hypothetical protein